MRARAAERLLAFAAFLERPDLNGGTGQRHVLESQIERAVVVLKGVRATLFEMFSRDKNLALSKEELMAALPGRKWTSIATWLGHGGLGNPKYAVKVDGKPQPILIQKDENGLYRLAD